MTGAYFYSNPIFADLINKIRILSENNFLFSSPAFGIYEYSDHREGAASRLPLTTEVWV